MCGFIILLLKFNIYVLSLRFKEFRYQKIIYHHFKENLSKSEIFCLLVYGSIVVKMDNFHLFEEV
jgi:hypothetical protein